jgi:hypothetical protein
MPRHAGRSLDRDAVAGTPLLARSGLRGRERGRVQEPVRPAEKRVEDVSATGVVRPKAARGRVEHGFHAFPEQQRESQSAAGG